MIQKNLSDLFGRNWLNVKVKFDDAKIGLSCANHIVGGGQAQTHSLLPQEL